MLGCKRVVLLALVAIVLTAFPTAVQAAADEKECEGMRVCSCCYCYCCCCCIEGAKAETDLGVVVVALW